MSDIDTRDELPLLHHPYDDGAVFTPESLIAAVQSIRQLPHTRIPAVCVLEFDGDLTDRLTAVGRAWAVPTWACFHTSMVETACDGAACGLIPRTIGGPYAVLVAEQLAASGAALIVGLTSAGRIRRDLPIPSVVLATGAVRDEGTSCHYVAPRRFIEAPAAPLPFLRRELAELGAPVFEGTVWTTDAPYRETQRQIDRHAADGVLAVEMQAASLFAFSNARRTPVAVVAHVSNAIDYVGTPFDRGSDADSERLLGVICRAGARFLSLHRNSSQ